MVTFYDTDIFNTSSLFQILWRTFYFQVLDEGYSITVSQFITVGIDSNKALFYICNFSRIPLISTLWTAIGKLILKAL